MVLVNLHLKAENLTNLDIIGTSDPFFTVNFENKVLFKSAEIRNNVKLCEWEPAEFELPQEAVGGKVLIKILDKDMLKTDVMGVCEIEYPFKKNVYNLNEKNPPATLTVLNNHGVKVESVVTNVIKKSSSCFKCFPCFGHKKSSKSKENKKSSKQIKQVHQNEVKSESVIRDQSGSSKSQKSH